VEERDALARIRAQIAADLDQARLRRLTGGSPDDTAYGPSRWSHVPLARLFEEHGNVLVRKSPGKLVTGHKPIHGSTSGTCMVIWTGEGRWWCSSCHTSGDAASFVMAALELSYAQAAQWLIARYGTPADWRDPQPPRPAPLAWRSSGRRFQTRPLP
jgi:CHC2 zinc finger